MYGFIDLKGRRFGRWKVLKYVGIIDGRGENRYWRCRCDCGKVTNVDGRSLRSKDVNARSLSCGCHRRDSMRKRMKTAKRVGLKKVLNRDIRSLRYKGKRRTVKEWAEFTDLSVSTIHHRIRCGLSASEALKKNTHTINGLTIQEHSARTGISYSTIWLRYNAGLSAEDILRPTTILGKPLKLRRK